MTSSPGRQGRLAYIVAANLDLTAGTRLGPYEILSAVGAGRMGEEYAQARLGSGRTVERAGGQSRIGVYELPHYGASAEPREHSATHEWRLSATAAQLVS